MDNYCPYQRLEWTLCPEGKQIEILNAHRLEWDGHMYVTQSLAPTMLRTGGAIGQTPFVAPLVSAVGAIVLNIHRANDPQKTSGAHSFLRMGSLLRLTAVHDREVRVEIAHGGISVLQSLRQNQRLSVDGIDDRSLLEKLLRDALPWKPRGHRRGYGVADAVAAVRKRGGTVSLVDETEILHLDTRTQELRFATRQQPSRHTVWNLVFPV